MLFCSLAGIVFYFLGSELFSSQSTSGLYSDALNKCKKNTEVWIFVYIYVCVHVCIRVVHLCHFV